MRKTFAYCAWIQEGQGKAQSVLLPICVRLAAYWQNLVAASSFHLHFADSFPLLHPLASVSKLCGFTFAQYSAVNWDGTSIHPQHCPSHQL